MRQGRQRKLGWLGLVVVLALAATVAAQEPVLPAPPPATATQALRVDARLVDMLFTVRDSHGRLVQNLRREDLSVFDNGQAQPITHFAEEFDRPLTLVLVFDKSTSVRDHFEFQKGATSDFLHTVLRPGTDRALLIAVDEKPYVLVPFTDQPEKIAQALAPLQPQGGTALFDAARLAIEQYLSQPGPVRKALILVTDGEDTVSQTTRSEVLALALSRNVVIYTLGTKPDGPGAHRGARRNLVRLSDETGGVALFPKDDPRELSQLFTQMADELRHQYSLGYVPPLGDGRVFHQVNLATKNKGYQVRARRGYYVEFSLGTPREANFSR